MSAKGLTGRMGNAPLETGASIGTFSRDAGANTQWAIAAVNARSGV